MLGNKLKDKVASDTGRSDISYVSSLVPKPCVHFAQGLLQGGETPTPASVFAIIRDSARTSFICWLFGPRIDEWTIQRSRQMAVNQLEQSGMPFITESNQY
jgi:hypothetical protein